MEQEFHFAKNINGKNLNGIINIKDQSILCLCSEDKAEIILKALRQPDVIKSVCECRDPKPVWNAKFCNNCNHVL